MLVIDKHSNLLCCSGNALEEKKFYGNDILLHFIATSSKLVIGPFFGLVLMTTDQYFWLSSIYTSDFCKETPATAT